MFRLLSRAEAFPRPSRADANDKIGREMGWECASVGEVGEVCVCVCVWVEGGVVGVMNWRTNSRLPSPPSAVISLSLSLLLSFQPARLAPASLRQCECYHGNVDLPRTTVLERERQREKGGVQLINVLESPSPPPPRTRTCTHTRSVHACC